MNGKKKVLVFPGGTEIGLEVWNSLKDCKDISLYSAGSNVSNHAPYVFEKHFTVQDVHSNNWIEPLCEIINNYQIDYIIPCHDDVIIALTKCSNNFIISYLRQNQYHNPYYHLEQKIHRILYSLLWLASIPLPRL